MTKMTNRLLLLGAAAATDALTPRQALPSPSWGGGGSSGILFVLLPLLVVSAVSSSSSLPSATGAAGAAATAFHQKSKPALFAPSSSTNHAPTPSPTATTATAVQPEGEREEEGSATAAAAAADGEEEENTKKRYGRISPTEYVLTPEQIDAFRRDGCTTLPDVLTETEVSQIEQTFDQFLSGDIPVPGKDFCDMSKPFGVPQEEWSIVNCMLPTRYHPPFEGNIYEQLTSCIAQQLFSDREMVKDYDQLLNKRPGKTDAVFAWHQDMGYWPGSAALGLADADDHTSTVTFSLAIDDSAEENGCLRYVVGSGVAKTLRPHVPLSGSSRDDGHALSIEVGESRGDVIRLAPCPRGSVTIHDEYVVHGSGGNTCKDRQRRTYVVAYRSKEIVDAERRIGFTHSHNDEVNWDTFDDGESHRVGKKSTEQEEEGVREERETGEEEEVGKREGTGEDKTDG